MTFKEAFVPAKSNLVLFAVLSLAKFIVIPYVYRLADYVINIIRGLAIVA